MQTVLPQHPHERAISAGHWTPVPSASPAGPELPRGGESSQNLAQSRANRARDSSLQNGTHAATVPVLLPHEHESERRGSTKCYTQGVSETTRNARLPQLASAAHHTSRREASNRPRSPRSASLASAKARTTASGRSSGFAQSPGQCHSFDRGRSNHASGISAGAIS